MSPVELCSAFDCNYRLELLDNGAGRSLVTSKKCPKCGAAIISKCPSCSLPLLGNPNIAHPICSICRADIRKIFAGRGRAASP